MILISAMQLIWLSPSVMIVPLCTWIFVCFPVWYGESMEAIALVGKENHSHNIILACHPLAPFTDIVRPIFLITFRRRPSFLKATTNQAIRKGSWRNEGCDGGGN